MIDLNALDFDKLQGLIPAIAQDHRTGKVLMLGFLNRAAFEKTLLENKVTFYSRTKQRLWTKGETSGNFLILKDILVDCDNDSVIMKVEPVGPVCHTGKDTCFGERNQTWSLETLRGIIEDRRQNPKPGSYTNTLLQSGVKKIAQKVGEEAVEVALEAKDGTPENFLNESADLVFHLLVLLAAKGYSLHDVSEVLRLRHEKH